MQVSIVQDLRWSFAGHIVSYVKGQIAEVEDRHALEMIKHGFASVVEHKQHHIDIENKMHVIDIEDKAAIDASAKSKKKK